MTWIEGVDRDARDLARVFQPEQLADFDARGSLAARLALLRQRFHGATPEIRAGATAHLARLGPFTSPADGLTTTEI